MTTWEEKDYFSIMENLSTLISPNGRLNSP